ncbi:uncharacterized protein LOC132904001 [Amyelois transitella]|uniref:uncharacterized protein LOC132904001 n=1 Tax=Amyelois transitella TaxID=680683 RepID=UPI00298F84D1|nr:uncharacterized protein LOC132904001 [Amyelois transitella]
MIHVAWWAACLTIASARVFDNCELARELQEHGVNRDHIATWVCIAFHESRLDTAAQNYGSGDHGIFQISELFWCGPGKACGVPCSAFRDDDIKDDIQCSLQIHEEHTRLQGDGFLAWVVYPQHCKQNTKKYLAECDSFPKNFAAKSQHKPKIIELYERNATAERTLSPNARVPQNNYYSDFQKPAFLAVSDIFRNNFKYDFEQAGRRKNLIDDKIKNVDDLKLPRFSSNINNLPSTTTKSPATTTTTGATIITTTVPPFVPWKVIETNQFRNRIPQDAKDLVRSGFKKDFGVSRYEITSKLPYSKPILPPLSRSLLTSTTYRQAFPTTTSYPRTTRALTNFPEHSTTLNSQRSSLSPLPTRSPFDYLSFRKQSSQNTPSLTTRIWTTKARTTPPPTTGLPLKSSRFEPSKPTQSVFDLYLNPTKRSLPSYKFNSDRNSPFKLTIFSGGTTTLAPSYKV